MKDAASDLVIVDADGQTFVSVKVVDRIPTPRPPAEGGPPGPSAKERFLSADVGFPQAACIVRCRQNTLFFSLCYLNPVLVPLGLRVDLGIATQNIHDQHVVLALRDLDGNAVSLEDPKPAKYDPLKMLVNQDGASVVGLGDGPAVDLPPRQTREGLQQRAEKVESAPASDVVGENKEQEASHRNEGGNSQHPRPPAKEQQPPSQQQAGSQQGPAIPDCQSSTTTPSSDYQGPQDAAQDQTVSVSDAARRDEVAFDGNLAFRGAAAASSQKDHTILLQQLRDLDMTNDDVLQAFLLNKMPNALSAMADARGKKCTLRHSTKRRRILDQALQRP